MKQDEIAAINKQHWERMAREGQTFTRPWLDLDRELIRRYARGELASPPEPLLVMYPANVLTDVEGKDVLCLGAGGGQQSAVFGLLGARVTVVDLAEGQLAGDRQAAAHYGYPVTAIQGDMRDLSCLGDDSFDLVYGTGMCYIPDVRQVYAGVARVLRAGGIYRVDFSNPATEFVDMEDWDGQGYRLTRPYAEKMRRREDGAIEFRHHLRDIFNGLVEAGLSVRQVEEDPRFLQQPAGAEPGSWEHWLTFFVGFAIVARKEPRRRRRR